MPVSDSKLQKLHKRMDSLGIKEEDLQEKFILGSGKGGQKVNKTESCVYLKHLPTGLEVKCQKDRFREMNRFFARRQLCELIEEKHFRVKTENRKKAEKIKKQKKRRSRRRKSPTEKPDF